MSDRVQAVTDGFRKTKNPTTSPDVLAPRDSASTTSLPTTRTPATANPVEVPTPTLHHPAPSIPCDAAAKKSKTHKSQGKDAPPADTTPNPSKATGISGGTNLSKRYEADDTNDESTEPGIEVLEPTPKDSSKGAFLVWFLTRC
ncbi:hypothetical protein PTTG_26122 [Puccinia triticina 1-1 BBBD Race 1]|uniref:Uncharacterized protein n=1 Tax=Puccinia triticina (isolate 1-1 / race 1 (BBBD)) TaxID=630390 RepID=A0A180GY98_PUCT1|nr:hypothetical protein PTTG_26122 [Puccinia triticina 1-1 BBBD Race 1]